MKDRQNNRNNSFGSTFDIQNLHLPFFKTKKKKVKVIFSSKGRHKLNVTPLIATFQKCIVLQHQKSLKKAQKSFTDYSMTMFQVFDETKTFKRLKKSGDWGDVKYAFIQDPIDYISITFTFTIYEYQFH